MVARASLSEQASCFFEISSPRTLDARRVKSRPNAVCHYFFELERMCNTLARLVCHRPLAALAARRHYQASPWGRVDGVRLPKAKEGRGTMILTKCAVCSTELGRTLGQKCGRCSTRYCGPACQKQHWEEGGHDQLCKKIKKAGGAEQYNANKKYTEVVSVAAEACAEDTKGQTCYICTQALHS